MTVTAFIRDKKEKKIYLGSDMQVTTNNGIYENKGKIYKKEIKYNNEYYNIWIGRAEDKIYTQLLENFFDLSPKEDIIKSKNFEEWWLRYIVPQWDEWVENRQMIDNNINKDFAHFIIFFQDKIYHVTDYYEISELHVDFYAIGEGSNHCKGAISALLKYMMHMKKSYILREAINLTNDFSAWCSNVSDIVTIEYD